MALYSELILVVISSANAR